MSSGDRARAGETGEAAQRQRLDKWLWFARVARTRSAAARLVADGYVRVNARPVDNPAKPVARGDILTIALERSVRVLRIVAPGLRRGPFKEAEGLYEDLSEKPPPAARG